MPDMIAIECLSVEHKNNFTLVFLIKVFNRITLNEDIQVHYFESNQ